MTRRSDTIKAANERWKKGITDKRKDPRPQTHPWRGYLTAKGKRRMQKMREGLEEKMRADERKELDSKIESELAEAQGAQGACIENAPVVQRADQGAKRAGGKNGETAGDGG